jgi:hypothetical protein
MYLSVNKVKALDDYQLELTFENNEVRIFDVKPYLDTGVFGTLRDERAFRRVKVSFDTVEWPGGIDLDPEVLYEKSKASTALRVAEEGVGYMGKTT